MTAKYLPVDTLMMVTLMKDILIKISRITECGDMV